MPARWSNVSFHLVQVRGRGGWVARERAWKEREWQRVAECKPGSQDDDVGTRGPLRAAQQSTHCPSPNGGVEWCYHQERVRESKWDTLQARRGSESEVLVTSTRVSHH